MKQLILIPPLAVSLACGGCVAAPEPAAPYRPAVECKPDALTAFTGQAASAETGVRILTASGARTLRWVPPRTAVTMDYRADRVTVSYDDNMVITRASCG